MHDATKTACLAPTYWAEVREIKSHLPLAPWKIPMYQLRRALLMVLDGRHRYVAAGVADRLRAAITAKPRKTPSGPLDGLP